MVMLISPNKEIEIDSLCPWHKQRQGSGQDIRTQLLYPVNIRLIPAYKTTGRYLTELFSSPGQPDYVQCILMPIIKVCKTSVFEGLAITLGSFHCIICETLEC